MGISLSYGCVCVTHPSLVCIPIFKRFFWGVCVCVCVHCAHLTAPALSPHLGSPSLWCCCDPTSHSWEGSNQQEIGEDRHREEEEEDQLISKAPDTHTYIHARTHTYTRGIVSSLQHSSDHAAAQTHHRRINKTFVRTFIPLFLYCYVHKMSSYHNISDAWTTASQLMSFCHFSALVLHLHSTLSNYRF